MTSSNLHNKLIEWVSDYCADQNLPFDQNAILAVATFGPGITEGNFLSKFQDCILFLHEAN